MDTGNQWKQGMDVFYMELPILWSSECCRKIIPKYIPVLSGMNLRFGDQNKYSLYVVSCVYEQHCPFIVEPCQRNKLIDVTWHFLKIHAYSTVLITGLDYLPLWNNAQSYNVLLHLCGLWSFSLMLVL